MVHIITSDFSFNFVKIILQVIQCPQSNTEVSQTTIRLGKVEMKVRYKLARAELNTVWLAYGR